MKYIPLDSFEYVNSLLQGVECNNYALTFRLEAFTCRHTREERQIACSLAENYTRTHYTPPLGGYSPAMAIPCDVRPAMDSAQMTSPSPVMTGSPSFVLPPPLVLGSDPEENYYTSTAHTIHATTTTTTTNTSSMMRNDSHYNDAVKSSHAGAALVCAVSSQTCHSNAARRAHASSCREPYNSLSGGRVGGLMRSRSGSNGTSAAAADAPSVGVATAEDVDERRVYLVAALNAIYGDDGYDFSVLTAKDFTVREELAVRAEVQLVLQSLHERCAPAVRALWPAVEEQVQRACSGCEYYEFCSPSCDPRHGTTVFSHHYLMYNKRRKVLVSLQMYAEDVPNSPCSFESDTSPAYRRTHY